MNSTVDEEVHGHLPMDFLSSIPNRLSDFFGKGWSKNFLVELSGLDSKKYQAILNFKL